MKITFIFTIIALLTSFNLLAASDSVDAIKFNTKLSKQVDGLEVSKVSKKKGSAKMYACLPYKIAFYSMKECQEFRHNGSGKKGKDKKRDCQCKKM